MSDWQLKTPVAFLIFNRPETTARVFAEIARAKPPILLVVADGPRADVPGESERCKAARAIVEQGVDWPCKVLTNYTDSSLGCETRVSSGLDWVFDSVEQAIILEDDCLPHPSFFRFCEELLERYRHDERIMSISGQNLQSGTNRTEYSYYFSRYNHCWGWASWHRAWHNYDFDMKLWPEIREGGCLKDLFRDPRDAEYWTRIFELVYAGHLNSWAYRWTFACWTQNGLTVLPNMNLISNIGFGPDAVHTKDVRSPLAHMELEEMHFPLKHPPFVLRHYRADEFTQCVIYNPRGGWLRACRAWCTRLLSRAANVLRGTSDELAVK